MTPDLEKQFETLRALAPTPLLTSMLDFAVVVAQTPAADLRYHATVIQSVLINDTLVATLDPQAYGLLNDVAVLFESAAVRKELNQ